MELIKIRSNEITNRKTIKKILETNSCFFGNINKIDRPLAKQTNKKEIHIPPSGMKD